MKYRVIADNREQLGQYLKDLGLNGYGVEVGVQKGIFSKCLLKTSELKKLYMVDIWRKIPTSYNDIANVGPFAHLQCMMQAFLKVYDFGHRAVMIREASLEAAELFPDQALDFVYLDADHSYEGALADIKAWFPKVRKGGILAGHDFINSPREENGAADFGVQVAVEEFAREHDFEILVTGEADQLKSWIIKV